MKNMLWKDISTHLALCDLLDISPNPVYSSLIKLVPEIIQDKQVYVNMNYTYLYIPSKNVLYFNINLFSYSYSYDLVIDFLSCIFNLPKQNIKTSIPIKHQNRVKIYI
jgi:hypothetical protein